MPLAKAAKGRLATRVSMVAGACKLTYQVPKKQRGCPTLRLKFFAMTVDHLGNWNWAGNYSTDAKQLLRKLMRIKLKDMLDDTTHFPIDPRMSRALVVANDTNLRLRESPKDPDKPEPPRLLGFRN